MLTWSKGTGCNVSEANDTENELERITIVAFGPQRIWNSSAFSERRVAADALNNIRSRSHDGRADPLLK